MKKITLITFLTVLLSVTSCEKYLDVNKNLDAPDYVEGYLYLSSIIQSYQGIYYDLRAAAPLAQMMGTSGYSTFAGHYYTAGSDAAGEIWRVVYWLQGMNLENLINQSIAEEQWTMAGIGYTIKAFGWDILTKYHGDLPMKQAFVPGQLSHDYDYQNEIYPQIRDWAREGIKYLEMTDATNYGNKLTDNDWIYKGDKSKWIKFAYAVIVRNLASLSNKTDFVGKYADELIECAGKSFQSTDDDATVSVLGGSQNVPDAQYNCFWSTARANLTNLYWQHDYAVQVMTGTVPQYAADGKRIKIPTPAPAGIDSIYYPYELLPQQIVCDTVKSVPGHFDPRVVVKLATTSFPTYDYIDKADSIKKYKFYGSGFTGAGGPIGTAPSFFGRTASSRDATLAPPNDGIGRWIYRDNAPYILSTCAEVKFCLAEAYWKKGDKGAAYEAFKDGIKADIDFTAKYIYPGTKGQATGGDKITPAVFNSLAAEYAAGPYVDGLGAGNLTLSHIMMQKWVALYPWGAIEAWVDLRKYHYELDYTGDYPTKGNGWDVARYTNHKTDTDPNKVYKGFYLAPARNVEFRNSPYNVNNDGSPCYRIRPRYNSEYMWNKASLEALKPISGMAPNYQCSIPWFAYPGEYPTN
jgi:hypothetical protein